MLQAKPKGAHIPPGGLNAALLAGIHGIKGRYSWPALLACTGGIECKGALCGWCCQQAGCQMHPVDFCCGGCCVVVLVGRVVCSLQSARQFGAGVCITAWHIPVYHI
eukprot:GHRQ01038596.1.p1 GENE.GHRQ01038596.1~~GHRQ01038596.1.p1  ORF type:complete len:107 (+),score=5.86 GHRQ01038596.1:587-907(+)